MTMVSAAMIVNYHIFDRSVPCHTDLRVIIYYCATFYYTHLLCNIVLQIERFQFLMSLEEARQQSETVSNDQTQLSIAMRVGFVTLGGWSSLTDHCQTTPIH